ncbi:hypothetical protein L484_005790 [Morus notabilis]|uniref:HMA domain-containing protein n=2 Tax=Morus notabilis TaxID=981085 RepID=W9RVH6_9ROSA|nr:hypothetical protein L484_005790 [Morus notabilis]
MDCAGCESKIKKTLKKLKGVDDVDVDLNMQKVTVMGWAEPEKILKAVRKTGKKAEPWPYTPESQHNVAVQQFYLQHHHGESDDHHEYYHPFTAYDVPNLPSIISQNYLPQNGSDEYNFGYYYGRNTYQIQPPYSTLVDHKATSIFSDDNPHAIYIFSTLLF